MKYIYLNLVMLMLLGKVDCVDPLVLLEDYSDIVVEESIDRIDSEMEYIAEELANYDLVEDYRDITVKDEYRREYKSNHNDEVVVLVNVSSSELTEFSRYRSEAYYKSINDCKVLFLDTTTVAWYDEYNGVYVGIDAIGCEAETFYEVLNNIVR